MAKGQEPWDKSSFAKRQRKQTSKTEEVLAGWSECGQEDPKGRRQGECPSTPPTQSGLYFLNSKPSISGKSQEKKSRHRQIKGGAEKGCGALGYSELTMLSAWPDNGKEGQISRIQKRNSQDEIQSLKEWKGKEEYRELSPYPAKVSTSPARDRHPSHSPYCRALR